jgi:hypothetical protein
VASVDDGGGSSTQAGATRAQFCDDALKHAPGVWKLLALDHIAHRDGGRSGHPARAPVVGASRWRQSLEVREMFEAIVNIAPCPIAAKIYLDLATFSHRVS